MSYPLALQQMEKCASFQYQFSHALLFLFGKCGASLEALFSLTASSVTVPIFLCASSCMPCYILLYIYIYIHAHGQG